MSGEVAIPERLADRPLDKAGRVIGWATAVDADGEVMQGVNVGMRCAESILSRLCGLCGKPLGYWVVFVGDEVCVAKREFMEPPMHEECFRYSMAACPYLANKQFTPRRARPGVLQVADRRRPGRMALYLTRGFRPKFDSDVPMAKADAPKSIEWF